MSTSLWSSELSVCAVPLRWFDGLTVTLPNDPELDVSPPPPADSSIAVGTSLRLTRVVSSSPASRPAGTSSE